MDLRFRYRESYPSSQSCESGAALRSSALPRRHCSPVVRRKLIPKPSVRVRLLWGLCSSATLVYLQFGEFRVCYCLVTQIVRIVVRHDRHRSSGVAIRQGVGRPENRVTNKNAIADKYAVADQDAVTNQHAIADEDAIHRQQVD